MPVRSASHITGNRKRALAMLHGAILLFGFAGLFGKWLTVSPLVIVLGRTTIAAAVLAAVRHRRATEGAPLPGRLAVNGIVLAVHWLAFFTAVQVADVATGLLGFASFPLFTLLLGAAGLSDRPSRAEYVAAALVVAGFVAMTPPPSRADATVVGLAWGALSGATFALLAVLNRRFARRHGAIDIAFAQNLWAAVALAPAAMYLLLTGALGTVGYREVMLLLLLGVGCTALAHTLFVASLRDLTPATAAVAVGLEPVYGIALALVLLGEMPTPRSLAGGVLIVAASFVVARARRRSG